MTRRDDTPATSTKPLARRLGDEMLVAALDALLAETALRGAHAWLVGGTVRDLLLGAETIADVDVVVDGDSLSVARAVADQTQSAFVLLDEQRGTARIVTAAGGQIDVNAMVGAFDRGRPQAARSHRQLDGRAIGG